MLDYANDKRNILGQYFTNIDIAQYCISKIKLNKIVIEPSYGNGSFLKLIPGCIGIELDDTLYKTFNTDKCININFYDYNPKFTSEVTYIGNPPYRLPAYSLQTHPKYIKELAKKYNVTGIKEEAIFFILKTFDTFVQNNVGGNIGYILPKTLFTNNSKNYQSFHNFLINNLNLTHIYDIDDSFDNVSQQLVFAIWEVKPQEQDTILYNNKKIKINTFFGIEENVISFNDIFKKTYLGSVPAESIFLSCKDESREDFRDRLIKLFNADVNEDNVISLLSYNSKPHLRALQNNNNKKIKTVISYIKEVQNKFDLLEFKRIENYKVINHRNEMRYYFRHEMLKKMSFVYILNPNPCKSFYFPGNPTKSSTDYVGFCEYDVNRNSSPGANRTIPVEGIEDNIQDWFLQYWYKNTNEPITEIFNYLFYVFKSNWYKNFKNKYQRFYFSIPKNFMKYFE